MTRSAFAGLLLAAASLACSDYGAPAGPVSPLAGLYVATTFVVTRAGRPPIDVLANGGSLRIAIVDDGSTTGTLIAPIGIIGGLGPTTQSMDGTATLANGIVHFTQDADTFVRQFDWRLAGRSLTVVNAVAGTNLYTITLSRP